MFRKQPWRGRNITNGSFFRLLSGHEGGVPMHMPTICVDVDEQKSDRYHEIESSS